jgi:hypothetical protein
MKDTQMNTNLEKVIDKSIQLEKNVSKIYLVFKETFECDAEFWWELVVEEEHHAAIIKSGKLYFEPIHQFPEDILSTTIEDLDMANQTCEECLQKYKMIAPTREEAFNLGLKLESSAGEIHFQKFMMKQSDSEMTRIFQQLNGDDVNHYKRIKAYMLEHNIPIN